MATVSRSWPAARACSWSRASRSSAWRSIAAARRARAAGCRAASGARCPPPPCCGFRASRATHTWGRDSSTRGREALASEPAVLPEVPHQVVTADVQSAEVPLTLRHDDCFGVFNEIGDIDAEARSEAGLYRAGVRHLSRLTLTLGSLRPLLLASNTRDDNVLLTVNQTNPDVRGEGGRIALPRRTLYITHPRF